MRSTFCFLFCFLLAFPPVAPAQQSQPSFRATVSEVLLDVVVRDKKGHIIRDLRPEDLQVLEDGVPQKLRHFEFVVGKSAEAPANTPGPPTTATVSQPVTPAGTSSKPDNAQYLRDTSVVSIVVESLSDYDRSILANVLGDFLKDELRPNTYVGVFSLARTMRVVQPYTNDAQLISAALDRVVRTPNPPEFKWREDAPLAMNTGPLQGPAGIMAQMMGMLYENELHDAYQTSVRQLGAIRALVQAQAAVPGRKLVLLASRGLVAQTSTIEALQSSISTANRANVTIYGLDTRAWEQSGLAAGKRLLGIAANASARQQMSVASGGDQVVTADQVVGAEMAESSIHADSVGNLINLAEGTGGKLVQGGDVRGQLRSAMEDVRSHYELTYSPANTETDGHWRKIQVKVNRPGAMVFTRTGYFALPTFRGEEIYPFETATLKALNTQPLPRQFDFYAAALRFRPEEKRTQFALAFEAPSRELSIAKEGQWANVHIAVTALLRNAQGQVVEKISKDIAYQVPQAKTAELRNGMVTFTAPFHLAPGRYTLETAALDRQSTKVSVKRSTLVVEQASGLPMSDLALVRRLDPIQDSTNTSDPLEAQGAKITPELAGAISPAAGDQVSFYAVAYAAAPVDAPISASMEIWKDGQVVMRSPAINVQADASGRASILARLPAERLTPGHYEARLSARCDGQMATRMMAFTVEAPK